MDEFRTLLAEVADEGVLDATERVLIDNLLEAGETEIVEIMTPRTDMIAFPRELTVHEAMAFFLAARLLTKATDELDTEIIGAFVKLAEVLPPVLAEQLHETESLQQPCLASRIRPRDDGHRLAADADSPVRPFG